MPCKILFLILFLLLFVCCYRDAPSALDGDNQAIFFVEYDKKPVINMPVTLNTDDYEMEPVVEITDDQGMVYFDHLLVADYQANVVFEKPFYSVNSDQQEKHLILIGNCDFRPVPSAIYRDTIITITAGQGEGLKINEIYYSGTPNDFFYTQDQFMEIVNTSSDTLYLDGFVIVKLIGKMENIRMIFQFPGQPNDVTSNYPVAPEELIVVAVDAYNHRKNIFNNQKSVDLSQADFEFRNSADQGDWDNPDIPNVDNIETGYTSDFIFHLQISGIILADGRDVDYTNGIDPETIIDFVVYSLDQDNTIYMDKNLDRGFTGKNLGSYTGKSVERLVPGFDTNNSSVDFRIIDTPTPGYQAE